MAKARVVSESHAVVERTVREVRGGRVVYLPAGAPVDLATADRYGLLDEPTTAVRGEPTTAKKPAPRRRSPRPANPEGGEDGSA